MDIARVSPGGQIIVVNAAKEAFAYLRKAFEGEAERLGINDIDDVVALVDEVRQDMWNEHYSQRIYR